MTRNLRSPLSYLGVKSATPPNFKSRDRAPTTTDINYPIGELWHVSSSEDVHILTIKSPTKATWTKLNNLGGSATFTDVTITGDLTLENINYNSTLRTTSDGTVYGLVDGTAGQLYIGSNTTPAWGNLTSSGGTVSISYDGTNLNLEAAGGTASNYYTTDDGNTVSPTAGGNVNVSGGTNIGTTGAIANTITINLDDSITLSTLNTDNLTLTNPLEVQYGGTGQSSFTQYTVLLGNGTSGITEMSGVGTTGQVLTSNGAGSAPTWQNAGSISSIGSFASGGWGTMYYIIGAGTSDKFNDIIDDGSTNVVFSSVASSGTFIKLYKSTTGPHGSFSSYVDTLSGNGASANRLLGYGNGYWVAISTNEAKYSSDGTTWTSIATVKGHDILYAGGYWLVTDRGTSFPYNVTLYYTTDPTAAWSSKTLSSIDTTATYPRIKYGDSKFVVSKNYYAYSTTPGGTWTTVSSTNGKYAEWNGSVWFNGDNYTSDITSSSWTASNIQLDTTLNTADLKYGNGIYCGCKNYSGYSIGYIFGTTSYDQKFVIQSVGAFSTSNSVGVVSYDRIRHLTGYIVAFRYNRQPDFANIKTLI